MNKKLARAVLFLFLFNLLVPGTVFAADNKSEVMRSKLDAAQTKGSLFATGKLGMIKQPEDAINLVTKRQQSLKSTATSGLGFKLHKVKKDNMNKTHIRLQQLYKGVPVYGKEVIVHTDGLGQVFALNGSINETLSMDTTPRIAARKAIEIAQRETYVSKTTNVPKASNPSKSKNLFKSSGQRNLKLNLHEDARLNIYTYNGKDYLCYVVDLSLSTPKPFSWRVFVDATTGDVINKYDKLSDFTKTTAYGYGVFGDKKNLKLIKDNGVYNLIEKTDSTTDFYKNVIFTWDYDILVNYPDYDPLYPDTDGVYNQDFQSVGVDAHYYADLVYNFFKTKFNRNSWDGNGASIDILTYVPVNNAAWDPEVQAFYFGIGDSETAPYSSGLDVVAHEFTHAVTDSEVGFVYEGQSGALSESYSDVFASLVDPDWTMGEDIVTPGVAGDATRDMSNPGIYGQPSNMRDYVNTTGDNGGVHINSGIPNKAFYNIASAIGREDAGRIYYNSLNYLTSSATFIDAKKALLYSAQTIFGRNSAQYKAVAYGWGAVGIVSPYELKLGQVNTNLSEDSTPFQINPSLTWDDGFEEPVNTSEVSWGTSNASVATVTKGVVTVIGRGTATITGTITTTTGSYSGSVNLNVTPAISQFQVDKPVLNLTVGGSAVSIKATVMYTDGTKKDVTKLASWGSSNSNLVSISSPGVVRGFAKGDSTVTVSYGNKSLEIPAKVIMPIKSLTVDMAQANLTTGEEVQLTPTANYSDGQSENVTDYTTWTSSNIKVATVTSGGKVTAVGKGRCTITAKFANKSARAAIEVTPPVDSISVSKPSVSLVVGGSRVSLKVTAYYIDGSKADVTKNAFWELASEGTNLVSVKQGTLAGLSRGETTLTIRYKDKSADVPVIVTPKVTSLTSSAKALDLVAGADSVDISLTAFYNDGSKDDVTTKAIWKSSRSSVATVDRGIITPLAKGTATISAEFNGKKVNIIVIVTPDVSKITLDKSEMNIVLGRTGRFILKAYYVDNTISTVTTSSSALWSSSDPTVVTVKAGSITSIGAGEAIITVQYKGQATEALVRVSQP